MSNKIIVTTGDLKNEYEILGPVYFSVTNKGLCCIRTVHDLKPKLI